jgi:hypothetical protein
MSIFDPGSGLNPLPWLQEKSLRALEGAARLVDLANEPDTSRWYAKELRQRGGSLIGTLAPMVALLHGARNAASHDEWKGVAERGSFALAAWCKKHDIADPTARAFDLFAQERADDETDAKAEIPDPPPGDTDDLTILNRRCEIYAQLTRRLVQDELPEPARRFLLWSLSHLYLGEATDVVSISRRFLPTDIGITPEEARSAYRCLVDRGYIEPVAGGSDGALRIRVVGEGINESKQPPPAADVTFGFPGARVGGQPTIGNVLRVRLSPAHARAVAQWLHDDAALAELATALQADVGADRVFVDSVTVDDDAAVSVRVRLPFEESDGAIAELLGSAATAWLRQRFTPEGA